MENVGIQIILLIVIIGGIIMINFLLSNAREIAIVTCILGLYVSSIGIGTSLGDIICKIVYGDDDKDE